VRRAVCLRQPYREIDGVKALLIGCEEKVVESIRRNLEDLSYDVDTVADGASGLEMDVEHRYTLIVMDMMLPGIDVWRICNVLRAQRHPPSTIILTPPDAGADAYLSKSCSPSEFLACVRTLLWKREGRKAHVIEVGDLKIDTARHSVTRAGREIDLSLREYSLLEALALNEGRVLTRDAIQEKVWQNEEAHSKTVDVYIGRLRRQIDYGHPVKLIQTVRGLGYCLRP
jgi:two-component system copper resistance phosphate regulon response regulator CusR